MRQFNQMLPFTFHHHFKGFVKFNGFLSSSFVIHLLFLMLAAHAISFKLLRDFRLFFKFKKHYFPSEVDTIFSYIFSYNVKRLQVFRSEFIKL